MQTASARRPWYRVLYIQVLMAVAAGILVGGLQPELGKSLKPLGDGFIKLIKLLIAPIIFCTVVHGIASMGDLKKLGRIGAKTLLYFEIVSTLALLIGLAVVNILQPGAGFNIDPATLDPKLTQNYTQKAHALSAVDFLLNIIPATFFDAFVTGDLLQVLWWPSSSRLPFPPSANCANRVLHAIETLSQIFFGIMRIVVRAAPSAHSARWRLRWGATAWALLNRLLALMAGLLPHRGVVRLRCPRSDRLAQRLFHLPLSLSHQRRAAAGARARVPRRPRCPA